MIRKNRRPMKESYSDIDHNNVWDAYDIAMGYLGAEEFCEALAKAMGTDELESNLEYIFRVYDIPFGDDEEIDEGCHGRKSKKHKVKKNEDLSDDLICRTCSNFKVEQTDTGTWVVRADSKRFGKQAIVFEGSSRREALNWMYKHIQPTKESVRKSSKRRMNEMEFHNKVYKLIDGETGEVIDEFATEDAAESYAREYIRQWATEDDPVDVDCWVSNGKDYTDDDYQSNYLWTLDSRNGGFLY